MYLMCGPREHFFFQCGPETTPKGWTPLVGIKFILPDAKVLEMNGGDGRTVG